MLKNLADNKPVFHRYDKKYEVFSDLASRTSATWVEGNAFFPQIALDYPEAGFLYNYRNMDDWLASRAKHNTAVYGQSLMDFHLKALGFTSPTEVIDHWRMSRLAFEKRLFDFFENKPKRLLSLDVDSQKFTGDLAEFIGAKLLPEAWKRLNVSPRDTSIDATNR
jgi:hypothetical protein